MSLASRCIVFSYLCLGGWLALCSYVEDVIGLTRKEARMHGIAFSCRLAGGRELSHEHVKHSHEGFSQLVQL